MKKRKWWFRAKHLIAIITCALVAGCGGGNKGRGDFNSLLQSGQEQMQKGRYRQAIASFEKAVRLDPNAPRPYMRLALIYEECLHEPARALQYYRKYQQVEKDAVKREEVRGWIVQLERSAAERSKEAGKAVSPGEEVAASKGDAAASKGAVSEGTSLSGLPVPVEKSSAYKNFEGELASALEEIRRLKAQAAPDANPSKKLAESEQRVRDLESEKELLMKGLREARANALRQEQAALQAKKSNDALRKENASLRSRLPGGGSHVRYYVVRTGETLQKIAGYRTVYGDSKKWVLIYEANRNKVRDPSRLTPGQVLIIPPG